MLKYDFIFEKHILALDSNMHMHTLFVFIWRQWRKWFYFWFT